MSRFGYISDVHVSIAQPTHDVVLVVDGGAIVAANAYVAYKYFF